MCLWRITSHAAIKVRSASPATRAHPYDCIQVPAGLSEGVLSVVDFALLRGQQLAVQIVASLQQYNRVSVLIGLLPGQSSGLALFIKSKFFSYIFN